MVIKEREDLLVSKINELKLENPKVFGTGIEGLMEYCINYNITCPMSLFQEYDKTSHKYSGKSRTAECFEILYGIDPFDIECSDMIFNCWNYLRRFFANMNPAVRMVMPMSR